MKNTLFILTFILIFASVVSAQTTPDSACPGVDVSGGGIVAVGEVTSFTANVDLKGKDLNLEYLWKVEGEGKITSGQGTKSITVELVSERNITVTVEVKGLPEGCQNTASDVLGCRLRPPSPRLADEFGVIPNGELDARVDAFVQALGNEPNAQGYIIVYGTDREILRREIVIKRYADSGENDRSRVMFVRGGENPKGETGAMTRLWIVPPSAEPPTP